MRKLIFLGTASGMPIASSSTSILVEDEHTNLLLDTSGGHGILGAFHDADKSPQDVEHIFISHHDSDHILGIVPLVRAFRIGTERRNRTLYCSKDTMAAIEAIFSYTASKHYAAVRENLNFDVVGDGTQREVDDWKVTFFDVASNKTPQMGCTVAFPDGKTLSFLGDEPLRDSYLEHVKNSDVLLHEAFCTSDETERFKPHEKHHGTAKEAGVNASKVGAKSLVLFHMEDITLATRKEKYLADVRSSGFTGPVFVPQDTDTLEF